MVLIFVFKFLQVKMLLIKKYFSNVTHNYKFIFVVHCPFVGKLVAPLDHVSCTILILPFDQLISLLNQTRYDVTLI
jgi:hypothetical protein